MNTYPCTNGERVTQDQIKTRMDKMKGEMLEVQRVIHGYNHCNKCGKNALNTYLDVSHTISIDKAKKMGKTELCWNPENVEILCRNCHKEKDGLTLQFSGENNN